LRKFIDKVHEKVITLRRGENEVLGSETPIDGLFNTRENALHVVVEGKIELEYLSLCLIFVFKLKIWFS